MQKMLSFCVKATAVLLLDVPEGFEFTISWQLKGEEINSNET